MDTRAELNDLAERLYIAVMTSGDDFITPQQARRVAQTSFEYAAAFLEVRGAETKKSAA